MLLAFFTLAQQRSLPGQYLLIGDSRSDRADDFREGAGAGLPAGVDGRRP